MQYQLLLLLSAVDMRPFEVGQTVVTDEHRQIYFIPIATVERKLPREDGRLWRAFRVRQNDNAYLVGMSVAI